MLYALFLALIYPAPALASSSHYTFGRLIIPPLPDVLFVSVRIGTASPFNLLLDELILSSFVSFMRTAKSRKSSPRVFVFLALSRGYWGTEKEQIAKQMPSCQPWFYKWQMWGECSQQPGATRFCWLFEGSGYSEKDRLPRELTVHLSRWSEQWGHAEGEDRAGIVLQSGAAADPSLRPMRAVPEQPFGSAANEHQTFLSLGIISLCFYTHGSRLNSSS